MINSLYSKSSSYKPDLEDPSLENSPDKLLLSEKLSPIHTSYSFEEEKPLFTPRGKLRNVLESLSKFIEQINQSYKDLAFSYTYMNSSKSSFLSSAEREVDQKIQEKKFEIERYQEKLLFVINELKNHKNSLVDAINSSKGLTDNIVEMLQNKVEKTISMLKDDKSMQELMNLDLEIVSKAELKEARDRVKSLQKEIDMLKLRSHELTPDTARIRNRGMYEGNALEEVDSLICGRIKDLISSLQSLSSSRSFSWNVAESPEFDVYYPLKCFDIFRLLEQQIANTMKMQQEKLQQSKNESDRLYASIKKINPSQEFKPSTELREKDNLMLSNQALNRVNHEQAQEIQELKSAISGLSQENNGLKQRISETKAREKELSIALRNQELSFEERVTDIKSETQNDMLKMQEALHRLCEENGSKAKIEELENALKNAKSVIENMSTASFEREIENVRKIYNDKYDELFRATSAQIFELEQKLLEANTSKKILSEEIKLTVHKEENKLKEQEFQRLNQLHNRELRLLQCEFEDFLLKSKAEIAKLGSLVEKALATCDKKMLSSLRDDIQSLSEKLQNKAAKVRDDSFSLSVDDERVCKRCGLNDNKSRWCAFHPFLAGADAQEFLYSAEWHRCRDGNHGEVDKACFKTNKHCYGNEGNANFMKIFDCLNTGTMTFAGNKMGKDEESQEKMLHDALFSTGKKEKREVSATDLLDSYISKYT